MSSNSPVISGASVPMRPADAFFWQVEAAAPEIRPLVAGLFRLDRRPDAVRLRAAVQRMTVLMPRLRQRVVAPAFGFGMPAWQTDPTFDLDYHLREVVLPAPGSARQLLHFCGELFSAPLDHLRPLWEAHLIEGVDGGGAAMLLKLHHAVLDGVGSIALFEALTQPNRGAAIHVPSRTSAGRAAQPAGRGAGWSPTLDPTAVLGTLARMVRGAAEMAFDLTVAAPASPWRVQGDGVGRRLETVELSLPRLRRIKRTLGVTLNDLILSAVAGALGRYHARQGRHPHELTCMVPMSVRLDHERAQLGNRVGGFSIRLPLDERDPLARVARIRAQTTHAKSNGHGRAGQFLMQAAALVPAPLFRAVAERVAGRVQLICSNVAGPAQRRYLAGARIEAVHPFAPVMRGTPLSIALISYGRTVDVGIDADPAVLADLERLGSDLEHAVDELERRADLPSPARSGRSSRGKIDTR